MVTRNNHQDLILRISITSLVIWSCVIHNPCSGHLAYQSLSEAHCPPSGYFRDELNCRKFYRCAEQSSGYTAARIMMKAEFTCPDGTVFDDELTSCNHIMFVRNLPQGCMMETTNSPGDVITAESDTSNAIDLTTTSSTSIPPPEVVSINNALQPSNIAHQQSELPLVAPQNLKLLQELTSGNQQHNMIMSSHNFHNKFPSFAGMPGRPSLPAPNYFNHFPSFLPGFPQARPQLPQVFPGVQQPIKQEKGQWLIPPNHISLTQEEAVQPTTTNTPVETETVATTSHQTLPPTTFQLSPGFPFVPGSNFFQLPGQQLINNINTSTTPPGHASSQSTTTTTTTTTEPSAVIVENKQKVPLTWGESANQPVSPQSDNWVVPSNFPTFYRTIYQ